MKLTKMMVACLVLTMESYSFAGKVTDTDGNTYPTVKIGEQIWMGSNLNIKVDGTWCYDDDPANCEKYGRLYTWEAAESACPDGWHLPSKEEFETLLEKVGLADKERSANLRASSWKNGLDKYKFSALLAGVYSSEYVEERTGGYYDRFDHYFYDGCSGYWSSTESKELFYYLSISDDKAFVDSDNELNGFSVRCIKDSN